MDEYKYEEENLDDFMINASIIISDENNPEKEIMIESLKQHLISIFDNKLEMQSFFKILRDVIFNQDSKKIIHKEAFGLYPLIFSFNPNSSFYYIDLFLFSINQSINEQNHEYFSYLSIIFSEVIQAFFSDENDNHNLIMKEYLLDDNKKYKLYEKLLNYCKEKIKINKKLEQSFGCLILTELIEKCPFVKEEKYLDNIFKTISNYLEDKSFVCILDLLNCTISLIFTVEDKFKPYANICLFRILDYLTDKDWMKRKLAINIVYTLVFYCREEIMAVKQNIIEFLNTLKEDSVEEVREVCLQTLKFIEEKDTEGEDTKNEPEVSKVKTLEQEFDHDSKAIEQKYVNRKIFNDNKSKKKGNKHMNKSVQSCDDLNRMEISKTDEKNKKNISRIYNNSKNTSNFKSTNIIDKKQKANEDYLRKQILKEKNYLEKVEKELNAKRKERGVIKDNYMGTKRSNKSQNKKNTNIYTEPNKKTENTLNKEKSKNNESSINNINKNLNDDYENNDNHSDYNNLKNDSFKSTVDNVLKQLHLIQDRQNQFLTILNDLQQNIDSNYSNLDERISALENYYSFSKNNNNNLNNDESYDIRSNKGHKEKIINNNFDEIKNKLMKGYYNEALIESKRNDKNLFKILPFIDKDIIGEIRTNILEDVINLLNKKIPLLNPENNMENINNLISFYMNIVKAKINIKLIIILNIKETLNNFKKKNAGKISKAVINNIDLVLKALKV